MLAMAGVRRRRSSRAACGATRSALIAAAMLTFAFLSVVYARIAVTDVGTFLPVAIAIWASCGPGRTGACATT